MIQTKKDLGKRDFLAIQKKDDKAQVTGDLCKRIENAFFQQVKGLLSLNLEEEEKVKACLDCWKGCLYSFVLDAFDDINVGGGLGSAGLEAAKRRAKLNKEILKRRK